MVTASAPAVLRRVFELELERGCTNAAVVGGLDRMLIQMAESGSLVERRSLARQVAMLPDGGYRSLGPDARESWLRSTIGAFDGDLPNAKRTAKPAAGSPVKLTVDSPVERLPGVGKAGAARLARLGVESAGGAVFFFPRRFNDFTDLRTIAELEPSKTQQTVLATIWSVREVRYGRRVKATEALLRDKSGALRVVWFNMPYVARSLTEGDDVVVSGRVRVYRGRLQMENPEFEPFDSDVTSAGKLVPVYPASQGLTQRALRRAVGAAVESLADLVPDPVPDWLCEREHLPRLSKAIRALHQPGSHAEAEDARRRLAIGEFLAIQVAVLLRRARWQEGRTAPVLSLGDRLGPFCDSLPFPLTGAQERSLDEILGDVDRPEPMLRLLQGDVGSGKTVIALAAMLAAVRSGFQAVLMAPTEILAEQHYRSLSALLGGDAVSPLDGVTAPAWLGRPLRTVLLTGSLTAAQKQQVRGDAAHGGADIVVGTHAILEDGVVLPRLGLAVVDEQHRFGVSQRAKLRQKGLNPHLLVMTATPIPRTLALTVYGDLEVSTIDEMPPGRKPVQTVWVQPHERDEAYGFIREHLDAGEQVFVICPLVEDSDVLDVRSAEEEYERLRTGPFRNYRVELLHGRMNPKAKEDVMARFAAKAADVLVSTSVIEVGIDIPNATVIVMEGAERFGLSQLHQFRGRVGRSSKQSYCMLFSTEEDPGPDARERLEAMVETTDGFKLAEVDLAMRGEGEAWGTLQSGANTMLRVARLTDRDLLAQARAMAHEVLARDPQLQRPEHRALAASVKPFLDRAAEAN
ncbi:MAG: ATP-dependent DNA helicase RecG [Dehalococcoidia bacterium]